MGGKGSKPKDMAPSGAAEGAQVAPPEAVALVQADTQAMMKASPDLIALPPTEAVELAVGMLTEKLYCPEPAMKFYKCFVDSGRSDAYSAAQDVCKKEHEGLMECVRERDINDVCQRFLGFFATQKCPKETQVAQACADKGGACQTEIEAAYGCGAKHVLALMAMEAEAQKQ